LSKYKRGVCPECKVKESDSRRKTLYQCKLCDRWFCAKHFEPKLVRIPDFSKLAKYPEIAVILEKEKREEGHPDFEYSLKRFKELDMEKKLHSKLIEDALNRSKAYRKKTPKKDICPNCGSTKQFIGVQAFDKETVNMHCKICDYEWTQPRGEKGTPDLIERENQQPSGLEKPTPKPKENQKLKKEWTKLLGKLLTIIVGSLISIGGLAIVLWEIYNPFFWTIFFIWFIPIPLVLIGIGILIFGFLVAIAGATS